jgi:FkbM family methyltransferase
MIKQYLKQALRHAVRLYAKNKVGVPVLSGPLRGCEILKSHGLRQLSMLFGKYEKQFSRCYYKYVKNATVIYDIGANIGYFSLLGAMNKSVRVIAFEPIPSIAEEFEHLMLLNNVSDRVKLSKYALSDKPGEVLMVTPGSAATGLMETVLRGQQVNRSDGLLVPMTTLDQFVFENNQPPPDLIKLDVEGAEILVLKGGSRVISTFKPIILAEIHGAEPAEGVWDYIFEKDYNLRIITGNDEQVMESKEQWMSFFQQSKWTILHVVLAP